MTEPSVEQIVEELAAGIRVRAPSRFSASYSSTSDFKIGALIADWRKRGEALKSTRDAILRNKMPDIEICDNIDAALSTSPVPDPAEAMRADIAELRETIEGLRETRERELKQHNAEVARLLHQISGAAGRSTTERQGDPSGAGNGGRDGRDA